ncbi:serine/threonine-protein kinase [Streptomyces sp. SID9124]|uniref:serine/threonine-protein kinase n=1 Tax=Streptomyces sp. SID9124 TaxID=2706108 RepID=UPI0013DF5CAF|nr:serine/threonine-protein kinase [Streptomyces sp. SID9124]NED16185.1 serine/threonine protein kinase [Streptomyces sp. SID9124]
MAYGTHGAELPEKVGGYTVERELGAGGMGVVYLARSRGGRAVAVKVARPELAADPHFRRRFRAEVEAARSVGGFHTAPVVDADPDAAAPWLATAYIPGPTLAALVEAEGPMDAARLRQLGAALAEALAAIHGCGLVHRDLKPGNIIMASDGPRVLDFGIARALESSRLTATGVAFGTPGFLAPEQAQGLEVGGPADVFALGAVLVAAAGGSAFGAGTPMGLMYRSVHEAPDLRAVPEGVRDVVASCLEKEPAARPTPDALLDLFVPGGPAPAPAPPTEPADAVPPRHAHPPADATPPPPAYPPVAPTTPYPSPYPPAAAVPNPYAQSPYGPSPYPQPAAPNPYTQGTPADPWRPVPARAASPEGDIGFVGVGTDTSLVIDALGVEYEAPNRAVLQFTWDEIGRIEYAVRGPKLLGVAVHLRTGVVHTWMLAARNRSRLREWTQDLPLILEYYG